MRGSLSVCVPRRRSRLSAAAVALILASSAPADPVVDLPEGFESQEVIADLASPTGFRFSPDGRMFICERIVGELRVAIHDDDTGDWELRAEPFATFDIPADDEGDPVVLRSSGLRDVAFDPDFATNGYVYAFYMNDATRQNRVVRLETDPTDPHRALTGSETLLLELPSNQTEASGSHNGGALAFGPDGMLVATTGDGWDGGDPVQSLSTFTGKLVRISSTGEIPADNPFYDQTSGDHRAIYALGLRNPFTMSRHPVSGALYVNDVVAGAKANVLIAAPAANYGHDGYGGIGVETDAWVDAGDAGGQVISGGAWLPGWSEWPIEYEGGYFVSMWGGNDAEPGLVHHVDPEGPTVNGFASAVGRIDSYTGAMLKPVTPAFGPDGHLYYALTTYQTDEGSVHRIAWTGAPLNTGEAGSAIRISLSPAPNPARASTRISFTLPNPGTVTLTLVDVMGRVVDRLLAGPEEAGSHELHLDTGAYEPGVYYVRLEAGPTMRMRKLVIVP